MQPSQLTPTPKMPSNNLTPENIPMVAIDFMNQTHKEEVAIVISLMEKLKAASDELNNKGISESLIQWLKHTEAHFQRENELMLEMNFPPYLVHSGEHENALNVMRVVINAWEKNKDLQQLSDYVFRQWPDWFKAHVNSMDTVTANFAKMKGVG
jgi:hemerythrin